MAPRIACKETVRDDIPKKIKYIQFGVLSRHEVAQVSEVEVFQRDLYSFSTGARDVVEYGALDRRLGPSEKSSQCTTCHRDLKDCIGHFGHIRLTLPVFHYGYFKCIINILQDICKTCSRVMLEEKGKRAHLKRMRSAPDNLTKQRYLKAMNTACKKHVNCPHCGAVNGTVKKIGPLRVIHDRYRSKKVVNAKDDFHKTFETAISMQPEIRTHLGKAMDDLNPLRVLRLFENIPDEDCELLGMVPEYGRPESYIWTVFPVPPGCIRPSVVADVQASNEDDLTIKLSEIIFTNAMIRQACIDGQPITQIMEQWEFLQLTAALYINSEMPGIPLTMTASKGSRGLTQRLKGKQGRFRGNLSGKRVDFSGRTVISPDPNMRIDQVAVPVHVAKVLTYPERATNHNIERLRDLVRNGPDVYPGANYIVMGSNGMKKFLKFGNRQQIAKDMRTGDVVERHMADDDVVLFNRQPSLHKLSIMSHFAKIQPWRTFRFNECVCTPYNADFDGDEMNMHLPQTEEARSEALELMGVKNNLVTPRNGEPIIAATQDFITASYLLSRKDTFYTRPQFTHILSFMGDACIHFDLPPPCLIKPQQLWTGKQILGLLLRPNHKSNVLVNLETRTRSYEKKEGRAPDLCPVDGWLMIVNSELICGQWDKSIVGDGNKNSVFYVVLRDYGAPAAAGCMNRLAKLCARWLGDRGFSIGIQDVQPGRVLSQKKETLVQQGYTTCDDLIARSHAGKLDNQPGCNAEQTLESHISGVLSKIRDDAGQICMHELGRNNAPLIMATCGSKGSKINVCQMVACVGQQIISGSRIPDGFDDRSLPHFLKQSKIPPAKGFVRNSFYTGLTPTEFFFHAVSGREGLIDTAVKTAETGYMQRRLMKALEDLTAHYDRSVRNSVGGVVQFTYGDDGLDPTNIEGDNRPVEFKRNLQHAMNISSVRKTDKALLPYEILEAMNNEINTDIWKRHCSTLYIQSVRDFIGIDVAQHLANLRSNHNLPPLLVRPTSDKASAILSNPSLLLQQKHVDSVFKFTKSQLLEFIGICKRKYIRALIEPGTAVGAVGAQSIGEPGTQMTLKTFHFAGVASMNVTLGVPRIKEIINAAKAISTPIITSKLVVNNNEAVARIVKGRVEKTLLGHLAAYIEEVCRPGECYLEIRIDLETIAKLQLEVTLYSIAKAIHEAPKLKIRKEEVVPLKPDRIRVHVETLEQSQLYYQLQLLKRALPSIVVKGISEINRAVISDAGAGTFDLLVEGYGLRQVMTTDGIVGTETTSNHVMEVERVLGIEAARNVIINEIQYTMSKHGMTIDPRHVMLLGDLMTYKGEVLGITRFGVSKMKDSVLMLASFEKTTDHLFDAATFAKRDAIEGVSECIIMGIPMPIGTGMFKLLQRNHDSTLLPRRPLLFEKDEFHIDFIA